MGTRVRVVEPIEINVGGVDWRLLRRQKLELVKFRMSGTKLPVKQACALLPAVDGVINLLDSIQDAAAEVIGEARVFGRKAGKT